MTVPFSREELEATLADLGFANEFSVYVEYSGRGMFGDKCFGVVHDKSGVEVGAALAQLLEHDQDTLRMMLRDARQDSMGLSTITYFPRWSFDLTVEEEETD